MHAAVEEYNIQTAPECHGVYVYPAGAPPPEYIEAAQRAVAGSWQQRHASLHSHAPLCTSAATLTPRSRRASSNKRPIRPGISRLTRGTCRAREGARLGNQNQKIFLGITIDLVR